MDLVTAMAEERTKLTALIKAIEEKKAELDAKISQARTELRALDLYESAKTGKKIAPTKGKGTGGSLKQQILTLLEGRSLKRAEIIEGLGYKDDKGKQNSLSTALVNLKKAGKVALTDGLYTLK